MLKLRVVLRNLSNCSKEPTKLLGVSMSNVKSDIPTQSIDRISVDTDGVDEDYETMFVKTRFNNIEWGGPLRGGKNPEPTRFGDWERKGRCTDY